MSEKIHLKNVRLSYPHLFRAKAFEEGGKAKFSCALLLDPSTKDGKAQIAMLKKEIQLEAESKWGKGKVPKTAKFCLKDGNEKDSDGYEDMMFVTASDDKRPVVVDRGRRPVIEEDNVVYAGCYVNAVITLWAQDNKFGKRINANIRAVQFVRDGEAFSSVAPIDADEEFEDLDGDEVEGDLF